jgi:uncharacterized membrane protein
MECPQAGEFDHTAVAVLTKDADGKLQTERHDSTSKHLAWAGARLAVLVPGVGVVAGAGAGAIVGNFWQTIPKAKIREAATLLESGESGLIVVAVNKQGSGSRSYMRGPRDIAHGQRLSSNGRPERRWA